MHCSCQCLYEHPCNGSLWAVCVSGREDRDKLIASAKGLLVKSFPQTAIYNRVWPSGLLCMLEYVYFGSCSSVWFGGPFVSRRQGCGARVCVCTHEWVVPWHVESFWFGPWDTHVLPLADSLVELPLCTLPGTYSILYRSVSVWQSGAGACCPLPSPLLLPDTFQGDLCLYTWSRRWIFIVDLVDDWRKNSRNIHRPGWKGKAPTSVRSRTQGSWLEVLVHYAPSYNSLTTTGLPPHSLKYHYDCCV